MRLLFSFVGGSGHFEPLTPIARAAAATGHTVAFAAQAAMQSAISEAGFTALTIAGDTGIDAPERRPLLRVDLAREERDLREGFARSLARVHADALLALCAEWRPDLLVCDEVDFGAMVAAERLGLPYAAVLVIAAGSFVRPAVVAAPLHALRAAHGLPPDPDLAMLSRYLVLVPFPPSFRDPAFLLPATAHAIRPFTTDRLAEQQIDHQDTKAPRGSGGSEGWRAAANPSDPWGLGALVVPSQPAPDAVPTVYFTLGTVFNIESGDLFARVLVGLRDMPIHVIATVGRQIDPAEFGPQPPNIQIARYIPQAAILPHCAAVVSHGGSGSVIGALAHGLPMVLIPMGADQPHNAARCAALGLARELDAVDATPAQVQAAVAAVLAEPGYRQAATRMRDEIAALPAPAHAVALLERLAAERRPLTTNLPRRREDAKA